ncbi:OmpA family protein [bacterium]|nr:OmpA family protein [bacterium]
MKYRGLSLVAALGLMGIVSSASAQDLYPKDNGLWNYYPQPQWRESESHPLRIVGYALHPIGWVAREAVFRPFSYLMSSTRVTRSVFGYREPFDYKGEPFCITGAENIPNCKQILPMSGIRPEERTAAEIASGAEAMNTGCVGGNCADRQVFIPDVNFDFSKATLNDLGRGRVRQISQLLSAVPDLKIEVEGHADFKGTDEYNNQLAMQRAEAVIKELSELGIDPARMAPMSYGKTRPVLAEQDDWARAVNRRVQFTVQGSGQEIAKVEAELPPAKTN